METKDYWSLGLSCSAIVITIIWNLLNRKYTNDTAKAVRGENFAYEEWKSKRGEVLKSLREFESGYRAFNALSHGADQPKELKTKIEECGRKLVDAHGSLMTELGRIGPNWEQFGYGVEVGGESDWDQINTALFLASKQPKSPEIRHAISSIRAFGLSITRTIQEEISIKTNEHDPVKW